MLMNKDSLAHFILIRQSHLTITFRLFIILLTIPHTTPEIK